MFIGLPARRTALMQRQSRSRTAAMIANPHAQTPRIAIGIQSRLRTAADAAGCGLSSGKGWLTWSIADTAGGVAFFAAGASSQRLPRLISRLNGNRNLSDAQSHSPKRTCARFLRKATVNSPAAAANTVDCQRWFASVPSMGSHALLALRLQVLDGLLQFANIGQGQLPRLGKLRHHR